MHGLRSSICEHGFQDQKYLSICTSFISRSMHGSVSGVHLYQRKPGVPAPGPYLLGRSGMLWNLLVIVYVFLQADTSAQSSSF